MTSECSGEVGHGTTRDPDLEVLKYRTESCDTESRTRPVRNGYQVQYLTNGVLEGKWGLQRILLLL